MRLGSQYTGSEILEIIRQRGYYEITLRPDSVNDLSFQELKDIIKKNQVRHRGLFYPHLADHKYGKYQIVENHIESFHQWGTHIDIWRFYKSGQFKQYIGFVEDRWDDHPPLGVEWTPDMESAPPDAPFLEPIMTILELTEILLFTSRLANEIVGRWNLEINLHKMNERKLQIRVQNRTGLYADYTCHTHIIRLKPIDITSKDLKIKHDELAVEKTLEIFSYFGWVADHLPSLLKDEQKKYYSHSF